MTPFGISHMEAVLGGVTGLERGVPLMLRHRLQVRGWVCAATGYVPVCVAMHASHAEPSPAGVQVELMEL